MTTQEYYEYGNSELQYAVGSESQGDSTNHATLACAYYLRALVEVLCAKPEAKPTDEGENNATI